MKQASKKILTDSTNDAQDILARLSLGEYGLAIVDTPLALVAKDAARGSGQRLENDSAALDDILVTDVPKGAFARKSGYGKYHKRDDAHAA
jgi:hypothetical protein